MTVERLLKRLWDAQDALGKIADFVEGRSLEEFSSSDLLRSAVERQLEITGEALKEAKRLDPGIMASVPDLPQIIGLRNVLAHRYFDVDLEILWVTATINGPKLRLVLTELIRLIDR